MLDLSTLLNRGSSGSGGGLLDWLLLGKPVLLGRLLGSVSSLLLDRSSSGGLLDGLLLYVSTLLNWLSSGSSV